MRIFGNRSARSALLLVLLVALVCAGCGDSGPSIEGYYDVVRVVDGDTIIVDMDGEDVRIRMIGIDCPESVHPDEERNTEAGKESSAYTSLMLAGATVGLEFDEDRYDVYDRMLAYVYLEDGTFFNELLVSEGYAQARAYEPNLRYQSVLDAAENLAQEEGIGLWAE